MQQDCGVQRTIHAIRAVEDPKGQAIHLTACAIAREAHLPTTTNASITTTITAPQPRILSACRCRYFSHPCFPPGRCDRGWRTNPIGHTIKFNHIINLKNHLASFWHSSVREKAQLRVVFNTERHDSETIIAEQRCSWNRTEHC